MFNLLRTVTNKYSQNCSSLGGIYRHGFEPYVLQIAHFFEENESSVLTSHDVFVGSGNNERSP
jgi:hypothetical protein